MTDVDVVLSNALAHHGVKGMKWGIHKNEETSTHRFQSAELVVDSTLHQTTKAAGKEVASLVGERYKFHISELKAIAPGHPEYERGTIAFVQASARGRQDGVINVIQKDLRQSTKNLEDIGWVGKDCGNTHALLTHETAHAIFHAKQRTTAKARDKALRAALKEAKKEGIPNHLFATKVSGYAATSGMREEIEAEMFSQYHWSSEKPNFVKTWGETLHREMGIDDTPFREGR